VSRLELERRAKLLAHLGNGWHLVEFAIALGAGIAAGPVALTSFAGDSFVEVVAASVIVWLFSSGRGASEHAERRAQQLVAASYLVLVAYIGSHAMYDLVGTNKPAISWGSASDSPPSRRQPFRSGQSKTAVILFAVGATARWADDRITANALNPGAIATNLQRHVGGKLVTPPERQKTPEQGAATSVLLATSPDLEGIGGRYFDDCNEAPTVDQRDATGTGVASYALDRDNAHRLWDVSEALLDHS
jgi:NAD(P)-dependent dehydrogenase (short-subunit alcohol dehydrogenase family)